MKNKGILVCSTLNNTILSALSAYYVIHIALFQGWTLLNKI
jgi:hypothetical protein